MSSSNRMNRIYLGNILRPAKGDTSVVSLNMLILQLYYRMKPSANIFYTNNYLQRIYLYISYGLICQNVYHLCCAIFVAKLYKYMHLYSFYLSALHAININHRITRYHESLDQIDPT